MEGTGQSGLEKLSVKPTIKWFEQLPQYKFESTDSSDVTSLKAEAQNLLESETKLYHHLTEKKRDKDFIWIKRILHSGTLSDKISAHTLLIQDSAVYNVNSLETLVGMVNTKGKRECLMTLAALKDLFTEELLVEDKKLKPFNEQPLEELNIISKGSPVLRKRILILWYFQDVLKSLYKKFLHNLDLVSRDTIEKTKQKAVNVMFMLLKENPEQEQFLLEHLVNKIGDPVAKVGSNVCYLLGQLLTSHPDMKAVVVQEVERMVFRPNLAERAKYYSLCFLNQIILNHEEYQLANHLIMIYFGQFKLFVKKGEVNTKLMSALLTGVARAYPFAKLKNNVIMDQLDSMYRLVHMVSFNISIQALMLIFQVLDSSDSISDRFYSALYRKLLDRDLSSSSRQAALLNLIYRALKKDVAVVRVKAFVKRLLQIALYQAPNLQCGILMLISAVSKLHENILEAKPFLDLDSDSDEHFEDMPDEDEIKIDTNESVVEDTKPKAQSSWVHKKCTKKRSSKSAYDLDCRNPLHAGAEFSTVWELLLLKRSFHPSVSLFAHQIYNSKEIKYSGDPLLDFTTARFLDRFVYRNPKKLAENFKLSANTKVFGSRKLKATTSKQLAIYSQEYLQQRKRQVPEEEKFIYQYLQKRADSSKSSKQDSDIESICSEDFEKLLDEIHPEDEGKDSLNFAKELGLHMQKKASKRKADSESENDSLISLDSDVDADCDFEDDIEFEDGDFKNAFGDLDEDMTNADICEKDFIGEGMEEDESRPTKKKAKTLQSKTDGQLLPSADEFTALLEENVGSKVDTMSGEAFKNKDKSAAKQLAWEVKRDRYIKGTRWQNKKRNLKKTRKFRR